MFTKDTGAAEDLVEAAKLFRWQQDKDRLMHKTVWQ
jgi:hypothetical protein